MKDDLETFSDEEIQVEDYNVRIFVTKEGYLKKIPAISLRGNANIKLKDGDEIVAEYETTNNSDILIFTDKRNCYKLKTYEIDDHKPSVLGEYLPTLLKLKDEEILFVAVTRDYKEKLIIGFDDGKVAKIELSAYETKQNRSMLKNAYADKNAIFFQIITDDVDVMAISSINKVVVFNTSMINSKTSRTIIGVQIMKSKNDSVVKGYYKLDDDHPEKEYYQIQSAGVGKYLRKGDFANILDKRN